MKVALILPVHNHLENTRSTLDEILSRTLELSYELKIILVDDGSTDGTSDYVAKNYPEIILLRGDGNLWWSGGVNAGVTYALDILTSDWILLWNNDIESEASYFNILPAVITENTCNTVIGSKIYIRENKDLIWSMGGYFNPVSGTHGMYGYYQNDSDEFALARKVDWLPGMGTVISKEVIEKTGLWDNLNFPQYHGDSDYTYRAMLSGFKVIVDPRLRIYNSVKSSGIEHRGSFNQLLNLITDIRSKSNLKRNLKFYRLYARSPLAYFRLSWFYFKIFGGFFKWKILGIFKRNKKHPAKI